uniref:Uncharacterized protein n=1 Tax=Tanacetum cinerariifolium TaxID=118510 RepID=A0A6L2KUB6_TANCI|nr:hypothetical protein [Tanacetum cinerariifolium]
MGAESGGRGQMGAESGGREEEEVMAGKLWVVQELEEVEQEEEEVVADEEEEVVEEDPLQEDLRQNQEKEHKDKLDEEALQQAREEDLMFERMDLEMEREEQQWKAMMDPLNDYRFPNEEDSMDVEMYNITKPSINVMVNTHESVTHSPSVQPAPSVPESDNAAKKKGKRTKSEPDVPFRIYHKKQRKAFSQSGLFSIICIFHAIFSCAMAILVEPMQWTNECNANANGQRSVLQFPEPMQWTKESQMSTT